MPPTPANRSEKRGDTAAGIHCFMDMVAKQAGDYATDHTSPMSPLLEENERYTLTNTNYPGMLTGRVEGRFLQFAVQLSNARNIVEIGTFTGYSALAMAEALAADGKILTIEHNPDHAKIARNFFARSTCRDKITLRLGEALDVLKELPDACTDLVFIDADKHNYCAYYIESMRILRDGGLIIADNVLWYGRVFDPRDDESRAMAEFNAMVKADSRAETLFLTVRDGISVIRKHSSGG